MSDRWSRRHVAAPVFGFALAALAAGGSATAQTTPGQPVSAGALQSGASGLGASQGVATVPSPNAASAVPPLPSPADSLFPDLFGFRQMLTDHGIAVILDTVDEFSGNISGGGGPAPAGLQTTGGSSIAGQVALETDINWEKLAGITGFSTHTIILGRYGGKPASNLIGDGLNPSQEIYGAGGNVVAHLVQAYGEETLAGGKVDITAGRIPLDDDFMSSPLNCNFQNNSLCGNPKTSTDNFAHSSYPDANWAFRVRLRPITDYYIQSGIFFSETGIYSDQYDRSGFKFNSSDISGEAFPVEIGYEPSIGRDHLPGHYKVGFIYDNNHHTDNFYDLQGGSYVLDGTTARVRTGSTSAYALFDQMVVRLGPGSGDGVTILGGFYHNDPETSYRADQYILGAVTTNFWHARPQDTIAALFTYQRISGLVGKTQALQLEQGLPVSQILDGASGVQTWDGIFELDYQIKVFRGVEFAPDFQYFIRPNAQSNLPNAAFLGFKTHVTFF